MHRRCLAALIVLFTVAGCGGGGGGGQNSGEGGGSSVPFACTAELRAGISIRVTDSASGNPISCGARAVVTAGTYSEAVDNSGPGCSDSTRLLAAFERPDTYAITVSKAGYRDFTIQDVVVTRAPVCHVNTVTVEARLSPL